MTKVDCDNFLSKFELLFDGCSVLEEELEAKSILISMSWLFILIFTNWQSKKVSFLWVPQSNKLWFTPKLRFLSVRSEY